MVVHADEAGQDGVAGEVEVQRGRAVVQAASMVRRGERMAAILPVVEDDGGVFEGSGAGAVDDADVVEDDCDVVEHT